MDTHTKKDLISVIKEAKKQSQGYRTVNIITLVMEIIVAVVCLIIFAVTLAVEGIFSILITSGKELLAGESSVKDKHINEGNEKDSSIYIVGNSDIGNSAGEEIRHQRRDEQPCNVLQRRDCEGGKARAHSRRCAGGDCHCARGKQPLCARRYGTRTS